jgi:Domain of unknown function (DUF4402)
MINKSNMVLQKLIYWNYFVIFSLLIFVFNNQSLIAQQKSNSASASISATIVLPLGLTKTVDLNFGNIAAGNTSGTVKIDPLGTISATGGIIIPSESGTVTPASFQVTGEGAYTYTITLPSSAIIIKRVSGSETMLVNNFTSFPSGTGKLVSGTQTILVGATLTVGASQPASEYKSESGFEVIVNYN